MAHPAPSDSSQDTRYTVERYLALFDEGVLDRDDRVFIAHRGECITLVALPDVSVAVDELLPGRR